MYKRSSKTMVEDMMKGQPEVNDMMKGQPEVNALNQKKRCYSKAEDLHQTLKTIKL